MKNLAEKIFARRDGESLLDCEERCEETRKLFRRVLGTADGKELLRILSEASSPFGPRYHGDFDPNKAAFSDGEKHVIGLLIVESGHDMK